MSDGRNKVKMTVEEKLVQSIKDEKLYSLVDDEDTLTALVKRAIDEALFKPRKFVDTRGYGQEEKDSPAVAAARAGAQKAADAMVGLIAESLKADPNFQKLVTEAMAAAIPHAIDQFSKGLIQFSLDTSHHNSMNKVREFVHQNSGRVPWSY